MTRWIQRANSNRFSWWFLILFTHIHTHTHTHRFTHTDRFGYLICQSLHSRFGLSFLMLLFSCWVMSDSSWPHGLQHTRLPCPSLSPRACSNSCPLSQWCHPTISSVIPFSSCLPSFPTSWSFPMNIQDWSPLGWTGWISLQSKGLSRVFSSTMVQKHLFFITQLSL